MKAIIYARVSTNRQGETGHSLDSQTERLLAEATRQGYEVEIRTEIGSGKRDTRPELLKCLADLKAGKAQALFCLDIDRLARSTRNALEIYETAKKQNWRLVIVSLGLDTATPAGEFTFGIMAMLAQLESRLTSERVIRQHEARRQRGIVWGVDQGFRGNLNSQTRRKIAQLHAKGFSLREIAKELTRLQHFPPKGGLWYPATIKAILESPQTKQIRKKVA
ncbi:MAG: recombinase family protein [Caulobacteraceae bacterium]|nr:recombinase family protein [Caulobacteraceae bacterium]